MFRQIKRSQVKLCAPTGLPVYCFDGETVNAWEPATHQTVFVELSVLVSVGAIPLPEVGAKVDPATRTEDAAAGLVEENPVAVAIAKRDEFATARQEGDC
jgi:hypothetical protein